jgi:DNA-binding transcriptional MerR regulator
VETHKISAVASEAGVSPDTLRYYERLGLLTPPERTATGYRRYAPSAARRVRFIKGAQRMGLRLREVKELLDVRDRGACPCGHARDLLEQRLTQVGEEIRHLQALRRELRTMLAEFHECPDQPAGHWWCEAEFTRRGGDVDGL